MKKVVFFSLVVTFLASCSQEQKNIDKNEKDSTEYDNKRDNIDTLVVFHDATGHEVYVPLQKAINEGNTRYVNTYVDYLDSLTDFRVFWEYNSYLSESLPMLWGMIPEPDRLQFTSDSITRQLIIKTNCIKGYRIYIKTCPEFYPVGEEKNRLIYDKYFDSYNLISDSTFTEMEQKIMNACGKK